MNESAVIRLILESHPNGVTRSQLVAGLVGPGCKYSEAAQAVARAMYLDEAVLRDGRLYAPVRASDA